jgi:hypothetical protein
MNIRFYTRFWGVILICAWSWSLSAPKLSFNSIKNLYKEGEFEKIRVTLEKFLKQAGESAQLNERIFAYKYLGVVYASEAAGYPVAETYFYQLLHLAPNAYLSDLYVSSAVENLFEKTKARFLKESRDLKDFDEFGNPRTSRPETGANNPKGDTSVNIMPGPNQSAHPLSTSPSQPQIRRTRSVWPWVASVGVGLAVGGGVYYWISSRNSGKTKIIDAGG